MMRPFFRRIVSPWATIVVLTRRAAKAALRNRDRAGVTRPDSTNNPSRLLWTLWVQRGAVCLCLGAFAFAQTETKPQAAARTTPSATADLYRQLGTLPLDPAAVYAIRDASIDREDVHISLNDGALAFTKAVNGRITGFLFEGEGEILIVPPDYTERHSLSLFAKVAVLSERFSLAYFRFADDTIIEGLGPYLRAPEGAAEFIEKRGALALSLSEADSLRTLIGLTYAPKSSPSDYAGEFLYGRVNGETLGGFEVFYDPMSVEQISVRQTAFTARGRYYDLLMSFPMQSARKAQGGTSLPLASKVVEITDYRIKMDVRPPTDLSGAATLTLRTFQNGPRALLFELSRYLKLSSVEWEVEGQPPVNLDFIQNEALEGSQLARRGNDTVTVVFPRPLVAGQTLRLRFTYAGSVMSEAGGGLLYVGARGTWFPNRGTAMSNFDLEFRHPAEWKLLATGNRVSHVTKDGVSESRFVSERPVPIAGFNLGKYVDTAVNSPFTKLDVYSARAMETDFNRQRPAAPPLFPARDRRFPPLAPLPMPVPDPSQHAETVGKNAAAMIDFLAPRIGAFPYSSLALTQLPGPNSQGWPGLVFLSGYVFLDKGERERSRFGAADFYDWVFDHLMTEHEVAHQWWGNNVFWESYRDQWLMEALSNYCALLNLERKDPVLFRKVLDQYRKDLLEPPQGGDDRPYKDAGPVRLGLRLNSSRFSGAYDPVVYGRGTWLMHMLREMLKEQPAPPRRSKGKTSAAATSVADPDALFFSVLKDLQARFAGKKLNTRDFLAAFEKVLPPGVSFEKRKSLDWFFDGWINGSAIPTIKLDHVRIAATQARTYASGVLLQQHAPELLVTSVPVYAVVGDSLPVFVGRVFADGERTEFRLPVPAGAKKILLDPYFTVLRQP